MIALDGSCMDKLTCVCSRHKGLGVQILATCQQAYEDGHQVYYSKNIFHLPRGPVVFSENIFRLYKTKHLAMICHMAVTLTLDDLCSKHTRNQADIMADALISQSHGTTVKPLDLTYFWTFRYSRAAAAVLREIWVRKLFFIRHRFPQLEDLSVTFLIKHESERLKALGGDPGQAFRTRKKEILIQGKALAEVIRYPDIMVKLEGRLLNTGVTLADALDKAHSWARSAIEEKLTRVIRKKWEDGKVGYGLDSALPGHDWCTARMLGHRQTTEEAQAKNRAYMKGWTSIR